MNLKNQSFNGQFKQIPKTEDFELELTLEKFSLKIRGLSKKLLIEKQTELSKEHAIYILEGPNTCYVGQSKDVKSRINNHKDNNKSDFFRCFILNQQNADWRGYLDYMESYAIREMESLGYLLENVKKPNPNDDPLVSHRKETLNEWIDVFLSFLPILGFKKSPIKIDINQNQPQKNNSQPLEKKVIKNPISIKYNGVLIKEVDSRSVFITLLKKVGISIIEQNCKSIFDSSLRLTKLVEQQKYGTRYELKENNKIYYLYLNISKNNLIKKILKIKEILQLNLEVID